MNRILRSALLLSLTLMTAASQRLRPQPEEHRDRGDVPGWVMITMMSALIVAALIAIAIPALTQMFQSALDKVQ